MNIKKIVEEERETIINDGMTDIDGSYLPYDIVAFDKDDLRSQFTQAMHKIALAVVEDFTGSMLTDMNVNTPPEIKELNEAFAEGVRGYLKKYLKSTLSTKE